MFRLIPLIMLLVSPVFAKPRYVELDEDDEHLYRAAYETPSYDHEEYDEQNEMPLGKLNLINDGMWAIKAKINELKAFNKAFAANLLSTKLKLKELIANQLAMKKHHHDITEKKKPVHNYQPQPYQRYEPQVQQYDAPQYPHDPYYGH